MDPTAVVGRRVAAFLIDFFLIGLITAAAWLALTKKIPGKCVAGGVTINGDCHGFESGSSHRAIWLLIAFIVAAAIGWVIPGLTGSSPGKALVGVRIVGPDGGVPGLGRAFGRSLMGIVDAFPYIVPYLTGFIAALTDGQHRRFADRAAKTLVVRKDAAGQPVATIAPEAAGGAGPAPGWYEDPQRQARLRWWDGSSWTSQTSD
jgi:uncharacterized RDD family membrane protein YckC